MRVRSRASIADPAACVLAGALVGFNGRGSRLRGFGLLLLQERDEDVFQVRRPGANLSWSRTRAQGGDRLRARLLPLWVGREDAHPLPAWF